MRAFEGTVARGRRDHLILGTARGELRARSAATTTPPKEGGRGPALLGYPQHGCVRDLPPQLDDAPSSSRGQVNDQQDDTDDEEDPCDLRGDGCHTRGPKHTRDQSDDEKH